MYLRASRQVFFFTGKGFQPFTQPLLFISYNMHGLHWDYSFCWSPHVYSTREKKKTSPPPHSACDVTIIFLFFFFLHSVSCRTCNINICAVHLFLTPHHGFKSKVLIMSVLHIFLQHACVGGHCTLSFFRSIFNFFAFALMLAVLVILGPCFTRTME